MGIGPDRAAVHSNSQFKKKFADHFYQEADDSVFAVMYKKWNVCYSCQPTTPIKII